MSNFLKKRRGRVVFHYMIAWTVAFLILAIVRGYGTIEKGTLEFSFLPSLIISMSLGPLIGFLSGIMQLFMEERLYRQIAVYKFLLWRLFYTLFILILLTVFAYAIYSIVIKIDIGIIEFALSDGTPAVYFYVLLVDLVINFVRQINMMLGEGNLSKIFLGKFYNPSEEKRIFMFLDLCSSTSIAEKLGHLRYSRFIQDCFNDLSVVSEYNATIYQYVGDEAVLTWPYVEGITDANCIHAFYHFEQQLLSRSKHYRSQYGIEPEFKAGIHGGMITVTEIGKYKREIAYHGDTINTTARIAGLCNELKQKLLLSADLAEDLNTSGFLFHDAGSVRLRGKKNDTRIMAIASES